MLWQRSRSVSPRGEGIGFQAQGAGADGSARSRSPRARGCRDLHPDAPLGPRCRSPHPAARASLLDPGGAAARRRRSPSRAPVTLALGPEGGFEQDELERSLAAGFGAGVRLAATSSASRPRASPRWHRAHRAALDAPGTPRLLHERPDMTDDVPVLPHRARRDSRDARRRERATASPSGTWTRRRRCTCWSSRASTWPRCDAATTPRSSGALSLLGGADRPRRGDRRVRLPDRDQHGRRRRPEVFHIHLHLLGGRHALAAGVMACERSACQG